MGEGTTVEPTAARMHRMRVAIVTQDVFGERLAGPAMRALAIGRVLAGHGHDVRVQSVHEAMHGSELVVPGGLDGPRAAALARWADVVVVQGDVLGPRPELSQGAGTLVCDLYDPVEMEGLVRGVALPIATRYATARHALAVLSSQLERGDFFLCASERQRLFWLGHLDAAGRINPATFDSDATLQNLIAIVPFGIEDRAPVRDGPGLRERIEGLGDDSRILLWGGGIYDWLDPLTCIEAMPDVVAAVPEARLVFMGTAHPNPSVSGASMPRRASDLVRTLGLEEVVRFHDGWIPYEERHNALLDAEVGVSGHLPHVETTLAFRTRILDCIWAGLPVVTTEGDALSDVVAHEGLGAVVPPSDPRATAAALRTLLLDEHAAAGARQRVAALAPSMRWSVVLAPLVDHCSAPRHAADRDDPWALRFRADRAGAAPGGLSRFRARVAAVRTTVEEDGLRGLAAKVRHRTSSRSA